jgi:hypothetical protein
VCGPLWPIGDDASPGEVESGKCGIPPGSLLHYSGGGRGRGEGHGFSYLLESHMTYLAGSHILRSWLGIRLTPLRLSGSTRMPKVPPWTWRGSWPRGALILSTQAIIPTGYLPPGFPKKSRNTLGILSRIDLSPDPVQKDEGRQLRRLGRGIVGRC